MAIIHRSTSSSASALLKSSCVSFLPSYNFPISAQENKSNFSALIIKGKLFKKGVVSFLPLKHSTFTFMCFSLVSLFSAKTNSRFSWDDWLLLELDFAV